MKKTIALFLIIVLALGMLSGCGRKQAMYSAAYDSGNAYMMTEEAAYDYEASGIANTAAKDAASGAMELPQNRKWIITMNLDAETEDLDAALAAVNAQITAMEGYIESQQISNNSTYRSRRSASMTVRIPANRVDNFANEVAGIANVTSTSRNVRDITLAYTDTEGRVNALKTEEQRLLELMEQADNMSDLLEIEGRLTEVRYQLESYASQLRLYDNQVDYATVSLYISQVQKYTPVEEPGFWKRISEGLSDSIVNLGENIVDTVVWFIVNLPYLIVLGLLGWGTAALFRRGKKKRAAKKAAKKNAEQ